MAITRQQDLFAIIFVETGVGAAAYRIAYPKSLKWKENSVHCAASKLLNNAKVAQRVSELQAEQAKKFEVTIETLHTDFVQDRELARQVENPAAAIKATEMIGRLFGMFDKDNTQKRPMVIVKDFTGDE